ncbi:zinc-ribbon domain-containing protein [Natronolimnohabitans sp. A-GB9]|uniref:zinc-ribbon domain-containing protein n=1 Tax=Natronolimnohabitans sp. A-GB9 TaxID=3069757 RepID=UPI0027B1268B|nr:zinc-ribbon domain-containing protein [Natronolimnohabitans sp. A-GB9]MDQ2049410.1 zinc-ribbon domain-containing protein [Natronolimnohabitans sp. A-GB9]
MVGDRRSSRNGGSPLYCSNCGTGLEPSMNYCPNCGAPAGTDTTGGVGSTREQAVADSSRGEPTGDGVTDRDVLEYRIAKASQEGWELEHDFGDHAVMVRRSFGSVDEHVLVALVTVWFTMGIGNALWGAYRYVGDPERIVLRAAHTDDGRDEADASRSTLLGRITAAVWWLAAVAVAAIAVQVGLPVVSVLLVALAVGFAALGTVSLPSVRRRLENRRPITANGRVRSVDERAVVAYDRSCAVCSDTVGHGLERTYRKEFCLLGVPLSASEGRNYYCRQCANGTDSPAHKRGEIEDVGIEDVGTDDASYRSLETEPETEREST